MAVVRLINGLNMWEEGRWSYHESDRQVIMFEILYTMLDMYRRYVVYGREWDNCRWCSDYSQGRMGKAYGSSIFLTQKSNKKFLNLETSLKLYAPHF